MGAPKKFPAKPLLVRITPAHKKKLNALCAWMGKKEIASKPVSQAEAMRFALSFTDRYLIRSGSMENENPSRQ